MLAELTVEPVPIPTTVALSSRMLTVGDEVTVDLPAAGRGRGGTVALSGPSTASYDVTGGSGTVQVATSGLDPGAYRVDLADGDGEVVATNELYVRPRNARVDLTTDAASYAVGRPDHGALDRRTGQPVGLDRCLPGERRRPRAGQLPHLGLHRRPRRRSAAAQHRGRAGPRPRPPGQTLAAAAGPLRVHYLLTDQYTSAGSADFTVR